jgi:hypothetical protein
MGTTRRSALCLVVSFAVLGGTRAGAQELSVGASGYQPFGLDDLDGRLPVAVEARMTLPLSPVLSFEAFATVSRSETPRSRDFVGFVGVQLRRRLLAGSRNARELFITYGAAGYNERTGGEWPILGHVGAGVRQRLAQRVHLRSDLHMVTFHIVPIGLRFVVSTSVDLARK